jgi:aarF domain-containing kinase
MMKGFNTAFASTVLRGARRGGLGAESWVCGRCAHTGGGRVIARDIWAQAKRRGYSTARGGVRRGILPLRPRTIFLAATGGAALATTVAFTDDVKHAYKAIERSARVAGALAVCINE